MRFKLYIDCNNAAFGAGDGPGEEVARILRDVAEWAEGGPLEHADTLTLRDVNGNTVGKVTVDEGRPSAQYGRGREVQS